MLRRTDTISEQDKQAVTEAMKTMFTYEEIIQDDPIIQNLLAQRELLGKAEGRAEGKAEGEIEWIRDSILSILSIRFSPVLAARAQPAVMAIQTSEALKMLLRLLVKAADEQSVCQLLDLPDEQPQPGSSE